MTVVEHVSISKHTENHQTEIEEKIEDNEFDAFVVYIRHFVNAERTSFKSWILLVYNERTLLPDPYMIYLLPGQHFISGPMLLLNQKLNAGTAHPSNNGSILHLTFVNIGKLT